MFFSELGLLLVYIIIRGLCNAESLSKQDKSEGFDSCDRPNNLTQIGFISLIFQPVWPWNLMDDPKNNWALLLYYIKLFASFQIHQWIQTGVTVRKHSVWVKIDDFLPHVILKFDEWPWKTMGHLFNATASFLHHFIATDEFKLELQSGKGPNLGKIWRLFLPMWPCNLMYDLEQQ